MGRWRGYLLGALWACAGPAGAAVTDVGPSGFTVAQTVQVNAPPAALYAALIAPERWWSPDHTYSGQAANLRLDPRAGGCWCETLPGGGSVEHMRVVNLQPGKLLRLSGALGPLQSMPVAGVLSWTLAAKDGGSELQMSYAVGGYSKDGFAGIAPVVDGVLLQQLGRLKAVAEKSR